MTNHSLEPIRPLEPSYGNRMTNAEAVLLCRYAKAACPQQQFDAYTPDAWFDLLGDLRFEDCKQALTAIVKRQPFVAPAEIRDEVSRVRSARVSAFGIFPDPPPEIASDPERYHHWYVATMRGIGDGSITREIWNANAPELVAAPTEGHKRALAELVGEYTTPPDDERDTNDEETDR